MEGISVTKLLKLAEDARENAFAIQSGYRVGAALETTEGVYTGVNVEVSGRSPSIHAEQLAAYKAIENGADEFVRLAIYHDQLKQDRSGIAPCGICQHTLSQFVDDMPIYVGNENEQELFELDALIGDAYRSHPPSDDR